MHVVATAGHVDHGKSTLVRALTGTDPDRLAEEKRRGLTIDLGFAWTTTESGETVAFVDVPGHERFLGNMLAGLGPAPIVMFVVAADSGWQAQSSDHRDAIAALGISRGLIVVTRADLAPERAEQVVAQARQELAGTGLADARAVVVSASSGSNLGELRCALDELVGTAPRPSDEGRVRLWVDRSFAVKGAGTVVTGTLGAGTIRTGDRLTLLDQGTVREATVRGLHSQDTARDEVGPVSRVAVNLRRVEDVGRSAVLLTPGTFEVAATIDVALTPVGDGGSLHSPMAMQAHNAQVPGEMRVVERATLHVGSADLEVHVRPLGAETARLTSDTRLPWRVGDRAILRDPGSRRLWSVQVLDVDPLPLARRGAAGRRGQALASDDLATTRLRSRVADRVEAFARLGLEAPGDAVRHGDWYVDAETMEAWRTRLTEAVRAHHAQAALSAGVPVAEAVRALGLPDHLPAALGQELVPVLAEQALFAVTDGRVHDPASAGLGPAEAGVAAVEDKLRVSPFVAPESRELDALGLGSTELAAAARLGRLLRLPDEVVLLPDAPARAMRVLAGLEQPFTMSQARAALGTTRRVAVPLLEHLDARGWTRRVDGSLRQVVR